MEFHAFLSCCPKINTLAKSTCNSDRHLMARQTHSHSTKLGVLDGEVVKIARLRELIAVPDLLDPDKTLLCEFLRLTQERHLPLNIHLEKCHMLQEKKLQTNCTR